MKLIIEGNKIVKSWAEFVIDQIKYNPKNE